MWKCMKCKEYLYDSTKKCNCKEFTIIDEDGETSKIQARSKEEAAEKYAIELNECNDHCLMDETVDILVDGWSFRIGAEPNISYSVKQLGV